MDRDPFEVDEDSPASPPPTFDIEARKPRGRAEVYQFYRTLMNDPTEKTSDRIKAADALSEILDLKPRKEAVTPPTASFTFNLGGNSSPEEVLRNAREAVEEAGREGEEGAVSSNSRAPSLPTSLEQRRAMDWGNDDPAGNADPSAPER